MSTSDNLSYLYDIWVEYLRAFNEARRPKRVFIRGWPRRLLLLWEICPVWRRFERELQGRLDPYLHAYSTVWAPKTKGYKFFYDHWIVSRYNKKDGHAKIKSNFNKIGNIQSNYVVVYVSSKSLYDYLFTNKHHPGLFGAFKGRDLIHELRHLYQYSQWPVNKGFALHATAGGREYAQRHTEIDAHAVSAAFGYLTHGTGMLGRDKNNIEKLIRFHLASDAGQRELKKTVPEMNAYFDMKDSSPKEYRKFIRKSYKYFNELLSIAFDE